MAPLKLLRADTAIIDGKLERFTSTLQLNTKHPRVQVLVASGSLAG